MFIKHIWPLNPIFGVIWGLTGCSSPLKMPHILILIPSCIYCVTQDVASWTILSASKPGSKGQILTTVTSHPTPFRRNTYLANWHNVLGFHFVFLSHDNIVILSDDTNGVGGANLTPLICSCPSITTIWLLLFSSITTGWQLHVPRPFDQLALLF